MNNQWMTDEWWIIEGGWDSGSKVDRWMKGRRKEGWQWDVCRDGDDMDRFEPSKT